MAHISDTSHDSILERIPTEFTAATGNETVEKFGHKKETKLLTKSFPKPGVNQKNNCTATLTNLYPKTKNIAFPQGGRF